MSLLLLTSRAAAPTTDFYYRYRASDAVANYSTLTTTGGIAESSGNNRPNAIPTTSGPRPTLNTDARGINYLTFDGIDDRLTTGNGTDPSMLAMGNNKPGLTISAVVKINTALLGGVTKTVLFHTVGGGNGTRIAININSAGNWDVTGRRTDTEASISLTGPTVDSNWHLVTGVHDYLNRQQKLYIDGQLVASQSAWTAAGNTSATNSNAWSWGSNLTPAQWVPADYYEILGHDRALTDSEVLSLSTYANSAYNYIRSGWYAVIGGVEVPAVVRSN